MFWIFLGFILCVIVACYVAYKEAAHHELHKMRAAFEDRRKELARYYNNARNDFEKEELSGELKELEEVIETLKMEDDKCDLIKEIKDDIDKVKGKIEGLFGKE